MKIVFKNHDLRAFDSKLITIRVARFKQFQVTDVTHAENYIKLYWDISDDNNVSLPHTGQSILDLARTNLDKMRVLSDVGVRSAAFYSTVILY